MKNTKILLIILFCIVAYQDDLFCQFEQTWVSKYVGPNDRQDISNDIVIDNSNSIFISGLVQEQNNSFDMCVIKFLPTGDTHWVRLYNNTFDAAKSITLDAFGNVYVAGTSNFSRLVVKYNTLGVKIWEVNIGFGESTKIVCDRDNNVCITGYVTNSGSFNDFITTKLNSNGVILWQKYYFGSGNSQDYPQDLSVDIRGNFYVTGFTNESGSMDDFCTLKYDPNGNLIWVKKYNGPGNNVDGAFSLSLDVFNNVYVSGYSTGSGTSSDFCTVKYDSNGVEKWVKRYNGPTNSYEGAWVNTVDLHNNIYVGGQSPGTSGGDDYCLIKYDNNGNQLWVSRYNGPGNGFDGIRDIVLDSIGQAYVTGISLGGDNNLNACTISFDTSGNLRWTTRYIDDPYSIATSMAIDYEGNIVVTGCAVPQGRNDSDIVVVKYSSITGIQYINSYIPSKYKLLQNYPNPFNPNTTIAFSVPHRTNVKLNIYNSLGEVVYIIANGEINAGNYKVDWDASNFPSGVYFYKIETDEFSESRKMVLVK